MFIDKTEILLLAIGTVLGGIFILLVLAGKKYDKLLKPLNEKEFPLCGIYGAGLAFLKLIKYDFGSQKERKRRQQMALLYDEKYAEYYLRINAAERVTLTLLLLVVGFAVYGLAEDIVILFVFLMFAFVAYYYVSTLPEKKLQTRVDGALADFATVVSKLALLINAGMILREAWEKIAATGNTELYQEMQRAVINMQNGMSEVDAYTDFGARSTSPEIKKFTSTLVQGVTKGNRELAEMVKTQSAEMWESRQHRARQQGEKAAGKLLIPILMMFIGILIMVIVPIFANLAV